jgi:LysR family transcriptional regulator for bpeEF and oprC
LTHEGEEFYQRAREILDKLNEAEELVCAARVRLGGSLRVGMPTAISGPIMMPRIAHFLRRHPELKLECRVMKQVHEMHAGGLDLLLRVGEPPESNLIARKVAEGKISVYAAPSYLKSCSEPRTPDELAQHSCLVFKPNWSSRPLDVWRFARGRERKTIAVPTTLVTDDRDALLAAAVGGAGIVHIGLFDPELIRSQRLRRLLSAWTCPAGPPVYALYRKTSRNAAKIAAFLDFVEQSFAAFDPEELTLTHPISREAASARALA